MEGFPFANGSFNMNTTTATTITATAITATSTTGTSPSLNDSQGQGEDPGAWGDPAFLVPVAVGVQIVGFMVLVGVCCVVGTVGNVLVLMVYCAKPDRRTTSSFIKVLAVIDLVVCAIIMPYTVVLELHLVTSDLVCRLFEFVRHVSVTASNLTLVAIAVERYLAVCVIARRLTVQHVHQGMLVVAGVSVVTAVPSMAVFATVTARDVQGVRCVFPHQAAANASFCHFTTSLLGPALSTVYQGALMAIFFLTFAVIVILYVIVYCSLWKRAKRRSLMLSFTIDTDVSSSGERRRQRDGPGPGEDGQGQQQQQQQQQEEEEEECSARLCQGGRQEQGRAAGSPAALGDSCQLDGWASQEADSAVVSARARRVNKVRQATHQRTARMLFLCTVVFLVTWLPFWVDVFNDTHTLCLRYLFFIGNTSNPLVYGVANSSFRSSLFQLLAGLGPRLTCCRCRHRLTPRTRAAS